MEDVLEEMLDIILGYLCATPMATGVGRTQELPCNRALRSSCAYPPNSSPFLPFFLFFFLKKRKRRRKPYLNIAESKVAGVVPPPVGVGPQDLAHVWSPCGGPLPRDAPAPARPTDPVLGHRHSCVAATPRACPSPFPRRPHRLAVLHGGSVRLL